MLVRYVGQHGEGKRTAATATYFVGLARPWLQGHGATAAQGGKTCHAGGRRGFLKQLTTIASARLLRHRSVRGWTMGGWSASGKEEARRGTDGLLVAALGRVRGACEHGGVSVQCKAGRLALFARVAGTLLGLGRRSKQQAACRAGTRTRS